ncbi:MAG: hypothetical protein JWN10_1709, partial [Solirubrobacterales bacterium]|nr:hypothetical protein [Solirubrobacterales bacterium]
MNTQFVQYSDVGVKQDDRRPDFDRLLADLATDGPHNVIVPELSRLFRSRRDRDRIDALISIGQLHLVSAREQIDTATEDGMRRYSTIADLLMLAYEGEWPSLTVEGQHDMVDAFVDDVLAVWLHGSGAAEDQCIAPLEDVRNRLHALVSRLGDPEQIEPLLAPYLEVATQHEPTEVPVRARALALVGVRNSRLEDLHLTEVVSQHDWRLITQAAAYALARVMSASAGEIFSSIDPFAGVLDDYPTAAAAFSVLASMSPGEDRPWLPPAVPAAPLPEADTHMRLTPEGYEVRHAMDERLSANMVRIIANAASDRGVFAVPSLKHISRNPRAL